MTKSNLLVEIGTEELPPKSLKKLSLSFMNNFIEEIKKENINYERAKWYATPRRLSFIIENIDKNQPEKIVEKKGPSLKAAYIDGKPTPAAIGWAKSNGITIDEAEVIKTDKGEWLVFKKKEESKKTKDLVIGMIQNSISKLPIPKLMRWGNTKHEFVRPVHTLCILLNDELIEGSILGVKSSKIIRGHRFMGTKEFEINNTNEYETKLESIGCVIADYDKRKNIIKKEIIKAADNIGGIADIDDDLLEEVTSIVEWPVLLTAKFDQKFLNVPSEALVHTMKGDQKYFPVYSKEHKLLPNFIFISNINSKDKKQVIEGNERVVRPRLSDAEFFFNTDKKQTLYSRLEQLDKVIFQKQLGTLKEKSERVSELSGYIANIIKTDVNLAKRAGILSKCDLATNMVMEFTDTQGIMGMHYARNDKEDETVAVALNEQYMPRFAGDELPSNPISYSLSIADKIDTLVGIFGINLPPKGDKDPFGLRRASIGILRTIVSKELNIDLIDLVQKSKELYSNKLSNENVVEDVISYILGRFKANYQDDGIRTDVINAVLSRKPTNPLDFHRRVLAVNEFIKLESAISLSQSNKRVSNILSKIDNNLTGDINLDLLTTNEEKNLESSIKQLETELKPLFEKGFYTEALQKLSTLKDTIDNFFNNVMVMSENEQEMKNRLILLTKLRNLFLKIADISLLQ